MQGVWTCNQENMKRNINTGIHSRRAGDGYGRQESWSRTGQTRESETRTWETGKKRAGISAGKFNDKHKCRARDDLAQDKETGRVKYLSKLRRG